MPSWLFSARQSCKLGTGCGRFLLPLPLFLVFKFSVFGEIVEVGLVVERPYCRFEDFSQFRLLNIGTDEF